MYWVPFCGVIILQSQPNTRPSCVIWELAPASAKIKASAENSNFRHTALFLSIFSRLHQLDKHCQATAQQLVELLNKQNQLFKEKQLLTEEVQFLRIQVLCQKKRKSEGNILQL